MEGALEHPEELTDRCCLSALAGLSKYLPSLGACIIIVRLVRYVNFWVVCFLGCRDSLDIPVRPHLKERIPPYQ